LYRPTGAIIFLTYRCTSRCAACNIWQRAPDESGELTWDQWQPILEKLARAGVGAIELFGGDALLRKDLLCSMIRFCSENGITTFFPTNSSALTAETARELVEAGLGCIYFSLDEVPEINGSIRGIERHFEKVERAIESVKAARGSGQTPRIVCITTLSRLNHRYLDQLLRFSSSHGVDTHEIRALSEFPQWAIDSSAVDDIKPDPYFVSTDGGYHRLHGHEAMELADRLRQLRRNRRAYAPMEIDMSNVEHLSGENFADLKYPPQTCQFCTTQMVLSPYGEVMPCLYFNNYVLGNLVDQMPGDVWGTLRHKLFCKTQRDRRIPVCDYCSIKPDHRPFSTTVKNQAHRVLELLR
jgi:radical SAM protein with 4Fe4S-binding SPASM domain